LDSLLASIKGRSRATLRGVRAREAADELCVPLSLTRRACNPYCERHLWCRIIQGLSRLLCSIPCQPIWAGTRSDNSLVGPGTPPGVKTLTVFFLQEKSQTQETLKGFLRRAQNEFGLRIKKIRSDNGAEFKNSQIEGFLEEEGIKHEFSSPYTPQQNGVVERKNRTLLDMARTMLDEYKTPNRFWAEAINTACYSINRLYLHRILKKTSYELLTGKKPNVSYFRVFGSKCFILVKRGRNSKFDPKAVEGFLLGYDSNTMAYRVFNKSTGLVEVSCDIVFDETNSSQVEEVDLDELDDEEAPCVALRYMSIGDV
jgi:hypothetical protein